jgi:hypothetical protein
LRTLRRGRDEAQARGAAGGPAISSLRAHDGSATRQGTRNPLRLSCDRLRGHLGTRIFCDHAIIAKAPAQICSISGKLEAAGVARHMATKESERRWSSHRVAAGQDLILPAMAGHTRT